MFRGIKNEMRANASSATITKNGTFAVSTSVTQLQVYTPRSVPLTIVGGARNDVAWEMPVQSTGPDEATARAWAAKSDVNADERGSTLALNLVFPDEGTQSGSLTLKVPARIGVRVENAGHIQVSHVAAVELRNPSGETVLSDVTSVTGGHRSGDLTVTGADTVEVTVTSSRSKFRAIKKTLSINGRNGECTILESPAEIEATLQNVELVVNALSGLVKINGDGGQAKVLEAHKLAIDVRRMGIDVEAAPAPDADLTIITTDEPLRLTLGPDPSVTLDAVISGGGALRAGDFNLQPTKQDRESRLKATLGKGSARIVLRNARGDIVIGQRK